MQIADQGFVFSRAELKALVAHASTDDTRPHVACVVLDPRASRAFATDGHRLAVCRAPGSVGAFEQVGLPRAAVDQVLRAAPKKSHVIHIASDGAVTIRDERTGVVVVALKVNTFRPRAGEATFPPIDHVLPSAVDRANREGSAPLFAINGDYLADLAIVCAAANDPQVRVLPMDREQRGGEAYGPVLMLCGDWQVVVMPMRLKGERKVARPRRRQAA